MKVLVTGRSRAGSWRIRGEQLGSAIGAHVEIEARKVTGFDVAVVVKRAPMNTLQRLRAERIPVVWDIVDAWPQPEGNSWGKDACLRWLRDEVEIIRPNAIVAATQRMMYDCLENMRLPVLWLPHHSRNDEVNPIREHVNVVGYEGSERYLGPWQGWLEDECHSRGWKFVVNPERLADLDIVTAFRYYGGYAACNWKSNVKLANAQGSGTPCVMNREAGYLEMASGGELWANDRRQLSDALDQLVPLKVRRERSDRLRQAAVNINEVARTYTEWLSQLKF